MPSLRHPSHDLLRLTTRVASMYHERGINQARIADQLGLSQARVSRLLKQAEELGIVRTTVHVPAGVHAEIEEKIELQYGLDEVIVVDIDDDAAGDEGQVIRALATSIAGYLELAAPTWRDIGISSWSETLLAGVNMMRPMAAGETRHVVQVLGGVGAPATQALATRLTERLAQLARAQAIFMPAPGVVSTPQVKEALLGDASCAAVLGYYDGLSALLMGVGALPPSRLMRESGNLISTDDIEVLQRAGAVGDVCLRFFDADGKSVPSPLDDRVLGIATEQIRATRRRVAAGGGTRKFEAIRAALRGGWATNLITDMATARRLVEQP